MTLKDLARLVVKLQGTVFLVYAVFDCTYLPQYYRAAHTIHEAVGLNMAAQQNLTAAIIRVGLNLVAALVLFTSTDRIIGLLIGVGTSEKNATVLGTKV